MRERDEREGEAERERLRCETVCVREEHGIGRDRDLTLGDDTLQIHCLCDAYLGTPYPGYYVELQSTRS